jgi:hypothetical protein
VEEVGVKRVPEPDAAQDLGDEVTGDPEAGQDG